MKTFAIRILLTSVIWICLLSRLGMPPAHADFTFGEPVNITPTIPYNCIDCLSYDGLEMYVLISPDRPGGYGGYDLWVLKRASIDDEWDLPENLGPLVNTAKLEACASISADGLTLCFVSDRDDPEWDIFVTTRTTKDALWGQAVNLGLMVNHPNAGESRPWISSDGLEIYFTSWRSDGYGNGDIYVTRRATINEPWGESENLGPEVNSEYIEFAPCLSADGLVLLFSDAWGPVVSGVPPRPAGYGGCDIWMTRRASLSDPWEEPMNLGPLVNSSVHEVVPRLSPDGSMLYFNKTTDGMWENWQASIEPVVDFNSDGVVDIADVGIMIEHWQTDYPLCDIGPMPWGDGFVDAQDLMVLTKHLYESSRPKAHWKLDETEGKIAYDCVGKNHGTLKEVPVWRPDAGRLGGALEFHGIDDHVSIPFILDPAAGSFSVFAWVKCSDRGKVIISQNDGTGTRWLWTDPSYGRLITWLMHPPFEPLISEKSITDDQWHHIGLVFDFQKFQRYLYVDGTRVARDTNLVGGCNSTGGLYLGADKTLVLNSFFCGLIDDVRIYDKVLSAEEIADLAQ